MDNLLPTLANIDVTSSHFREKALPYQQWEAKRTYVTPTTPSDIGHLLPPIAGRKPKRENSSDQLPIPPHVEPPLPRPAPIDNNLSNLYDPGLDPSPIGKEERGPVQPVRISRIVPRESLPSGQDTWGVTRPTRDPADDTVVTVLNGYRTQHTNNGRSFTGTDEASTTYSGDMENCVDIFVEGFSRTIDHATLLPSELYCRSLQNGSQGPPDPASVSQARHSLGEREGHLGLTVLLARICEWFDDTDVSDGQGPHKKHRIEPDGDIGTDPDNSDLDPGTDAAQIMFQREDGKPGPSSSAFRVQFEPGPLGVELEEHPTHRGIVQVRRVFQAGQAELDNHLSAGCLIVAVGDWGESSVSAPSPPTRLDDSSTAATATATAANNVDANGSLDTSSHTSISRHHGFSSARIHGPTAIRSLADMQEAVSSRQPDRLFTVWALDRRSPEAVAVLGNPDADEMREDSFGTWHQKVVRDGVARPACKKGQKTFEPSGSSTIRTYSLDGCALMSEFESTSPHDNDSLEYSLSSGEPGLIPLDQNRARGSRVQIGGPRSEPDLKQSTLDYPKGVLKNGASSPPKEKRGVGYKSRSGECSDHEPEKAGTNGTGSWEFETGGGIFDENDQVLAARKHPGNYKAGSVSPTAERKHSPPPVFPLGLNASAADEFAIFIWFCNNHESSVMNVSWIDYDGKRIPRRSLLPGACYFERSFATHPWIVHHEDRNERDHGEVLPLEEQQKNDSASRRINGEIHSPKQKHEWQGVPHGAPNENGGECCIVRLGDAMALARLTGSLIWNPTGRTLSVTKQAKVGLPGMTAATHASIGSNVMDGARLDPGKKRLCLAGSRRDHEEALRRSRRATIRKEKGRVLEEMKTWRTHPPDGIGKGAGAAGQHGDMAGVTLGGMGQGVPNLRVVMIGSSGLME